MALFLTAREVAERWGCSARQVQRLCASGKLRAMRLGLESWRIAIAAVESYELAKTTGSDPSPSAEVRKQEPIRPVFGVLEETGEPLALPEKWWETDTAGSSAAGRGRSSGKKKAALSGN